uniref:Uncharacterized protein n=1 Tax=Arundo donax TaxID=35708 RepID=A0A0A9FUF5_ARUDO
MQHDVLVDFPSFFISCLHESDMQVHLIPVNFRNLTTLTHKNVTELYSQQHVFICDNFSDLLD